MDTFFVLCLKFLLGLQKELSDFLVSLEKFAKGKSWDSDIILLDGCRVFDEFEEVRTQTVYTLDEGRK